MQRGLATWSPRNCDSPLLRYSMLKFDVDSMKKFRGYNVAATWMCLLGLVGCERSSRIEDIFLEITLF